MEHTRLNLRLVRNGTFTENYRLCGGVYSNTPLYLKGVTMKVILIAFLMYASLMLLACMDGRPEVKRQQEIKDKVFNSRIESTYAREARKYGIRNYKRKWESYDYKGLKHD